MVLQYCRPGWINGTKTAVVHTTEQIQYQRTNEFFWIPRNRQISYVKTGLLWYIVPFLCMIDTKRKNQNIVIPPCIFGVSHVMNGTKSDIIMTSSNGKIFRVTDPLYGEFTGHRYFNIYILNVYISCRLILYAQVIAVLDWIAFVSRHTSSKTKLFILCKRITECSGVKVWRLI